MISKKTYKCPVVENETLMCINMLCVSLDHNPTSGLGGNSPGNGGTSEGEVNAGSKGRHNMSSDDDIILFDDGTDLIVIGDDIW